jgi:hypothetical protein
MMLLVLAIDQLDTVSLEPGACALLIDAHQPAVASDIRCEDGGQPPFDPRFGHKDRLYQQRFLDRPYDRELGVSIEVIMSDLGHSRPRHPVPVPSNVR